MIHTFSRNYQETHFNTKKSRNVFSPYFFGHSHIGLDQSRIMCCTPNVNKCDHFLQRSSWPNPMKMKTITCSSCSRGETGAQSNGAISILPSFINSPCLNLTSRERAYWDHCTDNSWWQSMERLNYTWTSFPFQFFNIKDLKVVTPILTTRKKRKARMSSKVMSFLSSIGKLEPHSKLPPRNLQSQEITENHSWDRPTGGTPITGRNT